MAPSTTPSNATPEASGCDTKAAKTKFGTKKLFGGKHIFGSKNEIEVSQEELNQGLVQRVQQFPGQEQQVFEYFQKNPEAMAQIRAPLFEEKVVDFICEMADVTETPVSVEALPSVPLRIQAYRSHLPFHR